MNARVVIFSSSLLIGSCLVPIGMRAVLAQPANTAPDNSAINERDRNHQTLTPMDQSNRPADIAISRKIRRALVKDERLSTEAKNVKIITIDGAVTLRGPVKTESERAAIAAKAARIAGGTHVHNELEVAGR